MYFKGEGIEKDYIEAIEWFTKSADQGNTNSQAVLDMIDEVLLEDRRSSLYIDLSLYFWLALHFLFGY